MNDAEREPKVLLAEMRQHLALVATRALYDEQPELWRLGERGRAHTLEDFGHHFAALAALDEESFRQHVEFCVRLFHQRGFPQRWLTDGWRHMALVLRAELPPKAAAVAVGVLEHGLAAAGR